MNFHFWLDKFRSTELLGSKIDFFIFYFIFLFSPSLTFTTRPESLLPQKMLFFNPFCPTYLGWTCGPCRATCPQPIQVRFCLETIYFCLGSSLIYFKMKFSNSFFTFENLFSQKSHFWGPPDTRLPENRKNLTGLEFDENFLGKQLFHIFHNRKTHMFNNYKILCSH